MAFCALLRGKVLIWHWFEDDSNPNKPASVDGNRYVALLREKVWPAIIELENHEAMIFQQVKNYFELMQYPTALGLILFDVVVVVVVVVLGR